MRRITPWLLFVIVLAISCVLGFEMRINWEKSGPFAIHGWCCISSKGCVGESSLAACRSSGGSSYNANRTLCVASCTPTNP